MFAKFLKFQTIATFWESILLRDTSSIVTVILTSDMKSITSHYTYKCYVPGLKMSDWDFQRGHLSKYTQSSKSYALGRFECSAITHTFSPFIIKLEISDAMCHWWLRLNQFIKIYKNTYFMNYSSILGRSTRWKTYWWRMTSKRVLIHP